MALNNMRTGLVIILGVLMLGLSMTGCNSNASNEDITGNAVNNVDAEELSSLDTTQGPEKSIESDEKTINIDKLEIYHFHGTNQCYSCVTMGDYAEATVNTFFKDELEKGIIVFDHINGQLPQNRELVMKYGATGSSLWLGTYNGDDFKAEENTNVWYKIRNKQDYMNYLKGVIDDKLAGN